MTQYHCNHCGRKFEAEEKENLECPGCFWSTSVVKEEDRAEAEKNKAPIAESARPNFSLSGLAPVLRLLGIIAAVIILFFASIWIFKPFIQAVGRRGKSIQLSFKEQAEHQKPQKEKKQTVKKGGKILSPFEKLSEEEKNILNRKVQLSADRPVSPEEQKILDLRAPFQTGIVEKIPSQSWTFEKFKGMIAEQERFYKVPLPRSYKSKLEDLFKAKYLAAEEAFKAGNIGQARDLWVESLAFPVYLNNLARHRGVVLTMMRPFINDTLSKIGAINSSLVEGTVRQKEQQLSEVYGKLLGLTKEHSWAEASAAILEVEKKLEELEKPDRIAGSAPPYPAAIAQVDADIQATLAAIISPPVPGIADLDPIRMDVRAKRRVVESFMAPNVEAAETQYLEALDFIQKQNWLEAEKRLRGIESPIALAQDAAEKVKLLKKLQETALDSPVK